MNKLSMDEMTMYQALLLHSRADRGLRIIVARQLEPHGLTMMQWLLLNTVSNGSNSGMTMSQVADVLDVTLPQVTALMTDLVKMRLLKQRISTKDRRSRRLTCTLAANRLLAKIDSSVEKTLREFLSEIPKDQLEAYLSTLEYIADHKSRKPAAAS